MSKLMDVEIPDGTTIKTARKALWQFILAVDFSGGVVDTPDGYDLHGTPRRTLIAAAYVAACDALGIKPKILRCQLDES
jgi:hypothetical protein